MLMVNSRWVGVLDLNASYWLPVFLTILVYYFSHGNLIVSILFILIF